MSENQNWRSGKKPTPNANATATTTSNSTSTSGGPAAGARNPTRSTGRPMIRNSRFDALKEEQSSNSNNNQQQQHSHASSRHREQPLPPPPKVQNSRFAALAEQAREEREREQQHRQSNHNNNYHNNSATTTTTRTTTTGPPLTQNSRFNALAQPPEHEEDSRPRPLPRGPPPVAPKHSRFAGLGEDQEDRGQRKFMPSAGPPPTVNSRFTMAIAHDEDYVDREERMRREEERKFERENNMNRYHPDQGRYGGGGGARDHHHSYQGGRYGREEEDPRYYNDHAPPPEPREPEKPSRLDQLLKPKAPPVVENILQAPSTADLPKEHAENVLRIPTKKKEEPQEEKPKEEEQPQPPEEPLPDIGNSDELIQEFVTGDMQGDQLKEWTLQHKTALLPVVEKLVLTLLNHHQKLNPDPDCAWAEPSQFGAALLVLVEDDVFQQMQVLWGIQFYCEKIGFPKFNDEAIVQSMFRAMYKFDLVLDDAFAEWKEDESDAHEKGKMNAIIQTVEWFNWLEEDEEEEEEEYEEY